MSRVGKASTTVDVWSQEKSTCVMTDGSDVFLTGNSTRSNSGPLSLLGFEMFSQALATVVYVSVGDAVVLVRDRLGDATSFVVSSLFVYLVLCSTAVPYTIVLTGLICSGLNTERDSLFQSKKKSALKLSSLKNKEKKSKRKHQKNKRKAHTVMHQKQQQQQQCGIAPAHVEMSEMNMVETKSTPEVESGVELDAEKEGRTEVVMIEAAKQSKIASSNAKIHQDSSNQESGVKVDDESDEGSDEESDEKVEEAIDIDGRIEKNITNKGNWLTPIVVSRSYEITIMVLILMNTAFLTYEAFAGSEAWIVWVETVFSGIFVLEMISKMWGLTIYGYFSNKWNVMDFVIVVLAVIVSVLEVQYLMALSNDSIREEDRINRSGIVSARTMRLFRISRVTRVAKAASFFGSLRRECFAKVSCSERK
jgi:hypothetical protein